MNEIAKDLLLHLLLLVVIAGIFTIGFFVGKSRAISTIKTETDTITVYRTKFVDKPVFMESANVGFLYYTIRDTMLIKGDSVTVALPKEQRHYGDSTYDAWVSGYEPNLDSIALRIPERTITTSYIKEVETIRHNRVFADVQYLYDGGHHLPITANYGYGWKWGEVYGGAGYDPLTKSPVARAGVRFQLSWK